MAWLAANWVTLLLGLGLAGAAAYIAKVKLVDKPTPAVDSEPKAAASNLIDKATVALKGVLDQFDIPQPLQNIKRFVEVGVALAAIDGAKALVANVVPADRFPTVETALATARTEVASVLLTEAKPAA